MPLVAFQCFNAVIMRLGNLVDRLDSTTVGLTSTALGPSWRVHMCRAFVMMVRMQIGRFFARKIIKQFHFWFGYFFRPFLSLAEKESCWATLDTFVQRKSQHRLVHISNNIFFRQFSSISRNFPQFISFFRNFPQFISFSRNFPQCLKMKLGPVSAK
jgi:hypothetical protein